MRDYRYWILYGSELLTVIMPFLLSYALLKILDSNKDSAGSKEFILSLVFAIYIFGVLHFTGSGTLADYYRYGIETGEHHLNMIPFSRNIDFLAYILNIILFMPLGILLPLICDRINWKYIITYGFIFSLLIEGSQLVNNRRTDIDDVIMNTLGTMAGYMLFMLCIKIINKDIRHSQKTRAITPIIYIAIMFSGHFFFYNEFGLAKILFNIR